MEIKIALAGNPNCGKTTLFNSLTGSNQFVGNWPGVTVEKKEGKLKKNEGVIITDLPGIYSLSPYTLEEVVARNYLINEKPDVILNIIDGSNLERNLYLTTQLLEIGIPVVCAINMMDVVNKNGDKINVEKLSKELGCKVVEISALKGTGVEECAKEAVKAAGKIQVISHKYADDIEEALNNIEEKVLSKVSNKRWYAIKLFERDTKAIESLDINTELIEADIKHIEKKYDDDSESIITNERYNFISSIIHDVLVKKDKEALSTSDKIDRIVTNRWLGLPIFAVIMFLVYYISMVTFGASATDFTNDGVFGDGWHLLGIGTSVYEEASEEYGDSDLIIEAFNNEYGNDDISYSVDLENEEYDETRAKSALDELYSLVDDNASVTYTVEDEETLATEDFKASKDDLKESIENYLNTEYKEGYGAPDTSNYGIWVPGVPVLIENLLDRINCADWLKGLILDGIVAGAGAVLGFVPQMLVLFFLLAFLEACGYMARIAFVLDRIFRKFGLSGKSFIPMLIGTGCGVPGIMASRTIENERDRRMTIMTTTFIPCGAKVPFISMIAGALFNNSPWVSTSAYFVGMAAIVVSGIILKKTKMFSGDPAPFVMELPAYHMPRLIDVLRSMWERGWSFIKKAGTIIVLSTIFVWFTSYFGFVDGHFQMLSEEQIDSSILASIGNLIAWIFIPLGWGNWQAAVASITGLVAKENIVATMSILYGGGELSTYATLATHFTAITGYSFLVFNLLCAPCFAAIGAIKREMNNPKWTWFAILYQCGFAYVIAFLVTQIGNAFVGSINILGIIISVAILACMIYMLFFKKYKEATTLE
ncbi:MAG: ferrous iron transporter B [Erysipelotrichaceae bacterium]|nr:ferrous iron transporter B [Solobacterium sp.]MCI7445068.1 ferrous iron transporter B [Solobacterium sp.]MDY4792445.1 ferrous iron transporter B [Erysipelotrichaceae bacterium]